MIVVVKKSIKCCKYTFEGVITSSSEETMRRGLKGERTEMGERDTEKLNIEEWVEITGQVIQEGCVLKS